MCLCRNIFVKSFIDQSGKRAKRYNVDVKYTVYENCRKSQLNAIQKDTISLFVTLFKNGRDDGLITGLKKNGPWHKAGLEKRRLACKQSRL